MAADRHAPREPIELERKAPSRHAILMSPKPDSNAGGVERFCWLLAEILREEGWRTSIVGPSRQPGRWTFRVGGSPLLWSISTGHAVAALDSRPDLIVGNGFLGLGAPRGVPRIQVFHGTSAAEILAVRGSLPRRDFLRRLFGYWPLEAFTCRAGELVVVSDSAAEETARYYRRRAARVIANGVDTEVFKPRERSGARERLGLEHDTSYALFVGRPEYRKGADLLLPACRAAGWQLLHAGARGIPGASSLGVLTPEQLTDAYAAADCVLFPTRYEACSYVILEALACGTPVVTTRLGWTRTLLEQLPRYDELCVQPEMSDIAARLRQLADDDRHELMDEVRAFVSAHNSLERFREDWLETIKRVTEPQVGW
jgi:glycosyltransferase involved in cell wall biosynthesis